MSGPDEAAQMLAAFEVAAAHGCLVVRDSESDGDISGWDGVEDEVPHELFTADLEIGGALRVGDPEEVATLVLPRVRGRRSVRVLVDDKDWPTRVQVVVT